MGAKYIPTIKDLKANQRFQQKQLALARERKAGAAPVPARPAPRSRPAS